MSELKLTCLTIPCADLGMENPLPDLKGAGDAHADIAIDHDTVTAEEARYMGWGRLDSILPYTLQDGYNRDKKTKDLKAVVLENEHLKALFLPSLGGRLWSLFDKDAGRELLHANPVFQPANLALRNAWFSGGVEWNCGIIGHSPFTCDDMAAETLTLPDGTPVLRLFAYERVRHLWYRIEAFLPDGARELYVRVRIDNARMQDTKVYWWSNMAVNEGEDVRVIVPARKAYRYGYGGKLSKVPVPYMDAEADKLRGSAVKLAQSQGGILHWDVSHATCLPQSMDFFFDVPRGERPFIAAVDKTGCGICQTSTRELMGRKLFAWGMGAGGRHWQSFLSTPESAYIELQSGLAHTQLEHLPMAAGESISWLEAYGPISADGSTVQGRDWDAAVNAIANALEARSPEAALVERHRAVSEALDGRHGQVIHTGMGYALCERELLGDSFSFAGLSPDALNRGKNENLWLTLCRTGALPCPDPLSPPLSYQISPEWEERLIAALSAGCDHWFIHYHLGVMAHYRADREKAEQEYRLSLEKADNPWALRGLALLHPENAADLLLRAARMVLIRPLAVEALEALLEEKRYRDILAFYDELPHSLKNDGRIKTCLIAALMRLGCVDEAEQALKSGIVLTDIREGNTLLTDLWFELAAIRHAGRADEDSLAWAAENAPPPGDLDFRML